LAGGRGGALLSGLLGDLADSLVWGRVSGVGAALIIRQLIGHAWRLKTGGIRTQQLRHWRPRPQQLRHWRPRPQRRCRWSGFPRQWRRGWWVRVCHASANTEGGHAQRTSEAGSCQQVPDTHAQSLPSSYVSQTGSEGGRILVGAVDAFRQSNEPGRVRLWPKPASEAAWSDQPTHAKLMR
jgi:hypothetical protein